MIYIMEHYRILHVDDIIIIYSEKICSNIDCVNVNER